MFHIFKVVYKTYINNNYSKKITIVVILKKYMNIKYKRFDPNM